LPLKGWDMKIDLRVGRVVVAGSAPVGFERLLDDLMAHEGDIEPAATIMPQCVLVFSLVIVCKHSLKYTL